MADLTLTDKQRAFEAWRQLQPTGENACCSNPTHKFSNYCKREEAWQHYCVIRDSEVYEGRKIRVLRLIREQEDKEVVI